MGYRSRKLNMSHSLTPYGCLCNFDTTSVTNNALIADFLIFTTMALPVLTRSEYLLAVKAVLFRFECSIVNCLRFFYFSVRPFFYFLW